ncbi:O-antigen ligase family protein [Candidatus Daviesbacteria bacterium]|nr:O-antigen ligase family protein [Candidatus Daviesbacteria bacterium]
MKKFRQVSSSFEKYFFILILLFLPTQLGKHFWPDFAYIFSLKIDYLAPTVYLWDILLIGLIISWFLNESIQDLAVGVSSLDRTLSDVGKPSASQSGFYRDKPRINSLSLTLLLGFLLSQLPSLLGAVNLGAGLFRFEQLVLMGAFGVYLSSINLTKFKNLIINCLSVTIIIESLIAIAQFIKGGSIGLWILGERTFSLSTLSIAKFNWYGEIFLRPYATFPHPNLLASYLVLGLLLVTFLLRHRLSLLSSHMVKYKFSLVLGSIAILLSFSRVAISMLILTTIFFLKRYLRFLLIIFFVAAPFLLIRFSSAFNFDNLSIIRRQELFEYAWSFFTNSPFFGVGLNNFINNLALSNLIPGPSRFLQPAHNIFLLSLAETGLIGALGFLLFVLTPILIIFKKRQNPFFKGLLFIWIAIFIFGSFDHYFLTLAQGQRLLFLIWGISLNQTLSLNLSGYNNQSKIIWWKLF